MPSSGMPAAGASSLVYGGRCTRTTCVDTRGQHRGPGSHETVSAPDHRAQRPIRPNAGAIRGALWPRRCVPGRGPFLCKFLDGPEGQPAPSGSSTPAPAVPAAP